MELMHTIHAREVQAADRRAEAEGRNPRETQLQRLAQRITRRAKGAR